MKDLIKEWSARIKAIGMTRREFCEKTGVSYSTYLQLKNPTLQTINTIETQLKVFENEKKA